MIDHVAVIAPVIEAVHVNGNDTVIVIDTVEGATYGCSLRSICSMELLALAGRVHARR